MSEQGYPLTQLRNEESEGNAKGVIQGQEDYPLNAIGPQPVEALGQRWLRETRHFGVILASPLSRAKETAEILARILNVEIDLEAAFASLSYLLASPRSQITAVDDPQHWDDCE